MIKLSYTIPEEHKPFSGIETIDITMFDECTVEELVEGFEKFNAAVIDIGMKLFGSGWVWLVQDNETKELKLSPTSNAVNPLILNQTPLLVIDVWEHAYYVDYRNARPKYIEAFWNLVNWEFANSNL